MLHLRAPPVTLKVQGLLRRQACFFRFLAEEFGLGKPLYRFSNLDLPPHLPLSAGLHRVAPLLQPAQAVLQPLDTAGQVVGLFALSTPDAESNEGWHLHGPIRIWES